MYQAKSFPGQKVVASGKNLLRAILQIQSPTEFFKKLHADRDDYLDFAEDYEPVKLFFDGEQKKVFEKALNLMKIYEESKTFIVEEKVEQVVNEIKAILKKESPYSEIPKLPALLDEFTELYAQLLQDMEAPVIAAIEDARKRVFDVLDTKGYKDQYSSRFHQLFLEITEKARTCNNVATMQNIKVEADALKVRLLNEISKKDQQIAEGFGTYGPTGDGKPGEGPQIKIKKRKNLSIKSVNLAASWQIETPQDVDKYIAALKERILKELDADTIINIEF